jgi:diphthine-ammonia ligase
MKLGVLFSGGKDSGLAILKAQEHEEVICLISILSENTESYMFHTPNISLTKLQAEALDLPLIAKTTYGEKEIELKDLKLAIKEAVSTYNIEGIVTGAVESVYQSTRIQKICDELGLWCFNPLWQKNQIELLQEIISLKCEVIISGVFAYPFDSSWLGRKIDKQMIEELKVLEKKYKINPAGEGGEIETTMLSGPHFVKKVAIKETEIEYNNYSGILIIKNAKVIEK